MVETLKKPISRVVLLRVFHDSSLETSNVSTPN